MKMKLRIIYIQIFQSRKTKGVGVVGCFLGTSCTMTSPAFLKTFLSLKIFRAKNFIKLAYHCPLHEKKTYNACKLTGAH